MGRRKNEYGLTAREEKFCTEVAAGNELTTAYRSAYNAGNMKPETVRRRASEINSKPEVAERIKMIARPAVEAAVVASQVTRGRIIEELALIAFSDITQIFGEDGKLIAPCKMSKNVAKTIRSIKTRKMRKGGDVVEITREDKLKALEMLGRTLAMFTDNTNNNNNNINDFSHIDDDTLSRMAAEALNAQ